MARSGVRGRAAACARRSSRNAWNGSSCSTASENPAAIACPPPVSSRPWRRASSTAAPISTPCTERPEPFTTPSFQRARQRRAILALLDAAGHDADHAGMPAGAVHHQHRASGLCLRVGVRVGGVEHGGLHILALAVDGVEPGGERAGLDRVLAQQQAQAEIGLVDAPGGVDARAERPAERGIAVGWSRARRRPPAEAARPGRARRPMTLRPCVTRARLTPHQRHDVAHRGQGHQVQQGHAGPAPLRAANQPARRSARRVATAARNATRGGAQSAQAGGVVEPVRVDGGQHDARRAGLPALVVVQHQHVGRGGQGGERFGRRRAAVDAHDQRGALRAASARRAGALGP